MRTVANISVTFTTLILLLFGASGIGVERCLCTGKMAPLTLSGGNFCTSGDDCCPHEADNHNEQGCDTVTIVELSTSAPTSRVECGKWMGWNWLPQPLFFHHSAFIYSQSVSRFPTTVFTFSPPREAETITVLRV